MVKLDIRRGVGANLLAPSNPNTDSLFCFLLGEPRLLGSEGEAKSVSICVMH